MKWSCIYLIGKDMVSKSWRHLLEFRRLFFLFTYTFSLLINVINNVLAYNGYKQPKCSLSWVDFGFWQELYQPTNVCLCPDNSSWHFFKQICYLCPLRCNILRFVYKKSQLQNYLHLEYEGAKQAFLTIVRGWWTMLHSKSTTWRK